MRTSTAKKYPVTNEEHTIEIKNNLQGNNSKMNEARNQINDMEPKEAKTNQSEQQEEKRIQKNEDSISILIINANTY